MPDEHHTARMGLSSTIAQPMTIIAPSDAQPAPAGQVAPVAPAPLPEATPIAITSGFVKIAGLGSLVQSVRSEITGLRAELPALQASAAALRSTVADLKTQIDSTHDDLKFEATTLGNGSGS